MKKVLILSLVFFLFTPIFLSFSQLIESEKLENAFKEALALYEDGNYSKSLVILKEIKGVAPQWEPEKVQKYIEAANKKLGSPASALEKREEEYLALTNAWEEKIKEFSALLDRRENQIELLEEQIKSLNDKLEGMGALRDEKFILARQVEKLQNELATQMAEKKKIETEYKELKESADAERDKKLQSWLDQANVTINELLVSLKKRESSIREKEQKISKLIDGMKEKMEEILRTPKGLEKTKEEIISPLVGKMQTLEKARTLADKGVLEKDRKISELTEKIKSLESELKKTSQESEDTIKKLKEAVEKREENLKEVSEGYQATIKELRVALSRQEDALEKKDEEMAGLNEKMENLKGSRQEAAEALSLGKKEASKAREKLQKANSIISEMRNTIGKKEAQIEDQKKQINDLNKNIEELRAIYRTATSKLDKKENEVAGLNEEVERLAEELQALKSKPKEVEEKIIYKSDPKTRVVLKEAHGAIQNLKKSVEEKNRLLKEKEQEAVELRSRVESLAGQLAKIESAPPPPPPAEDNKKEYEDLIERLKEEIEEKNRVITNLTLTLEEVYSRINALAP